jgi:predicted transcriptional regulator of viral defense system
LPILYNSKKRGIFAKNKQKMSSTIENQINIYFKSRDKISREELLALIKKDFANWSDNTINIYLSSLQKKGIIHSLSRGMYALGNEETFQPHLNNKLVKIASIINKTFPFVKYCVWESVWLNELMRHQTFKNFTIVEVEKVASEQVFNQLNTNLPNVFIHPDEKTIERYIATLDSAVIIKNLNSEAPIQKWKNINVPTLEKILVDIIADDELFAAQQGELEFIFKSAFDKYNINESKMKRYASRRNREVEIKNQTNIITAK